MFWEDTEGLLLTSAEKERTPATVGGKKKPTFGIAGNARSFSNSTKETNVLGFGRRPVTQGNASYSRGGDSTVTSVVAKGVKITPGQSLPVNGPNPTYTPPPHIQLDRLNRTSSEIRAGSTTKPWQRGELEKAIKPSAPSFLRPEKIHNNQSNHGSGNSSASNVYKRIEPPPAQPFSVPPKIRPSQGLPVKRQNIPAHLQSSTNTETEAEVVDLISNGDGDGPFSLTVADEHAATDSSPISASSTTAVLSDDSTVRGSSGGGTNTTNTTNNTTPSTTTTAPTNLTNTTTITGKRRADQAERVTTDRDGTDSTQKQAGVLSAPVHTAS